MRRTHARWRKLPAPCFFFTLPSPPAMERHLLKELALGVFAMSKRSFFFFFSSNNNSNNNKMRIIKLYAPFCPLLHSNFCFLRRRKREIKGGGNFRRSARPLPPPPLIAHTCTHYIQLQKEKKRKEKIQPRSIDNRGSGRRIRVRLLLYNYIHICTYMLSIPVYFENVIAWKLSHDGAPRL